MTIHPLMLRTLLALTFLTTATTHAQWTSTHRHLPPEVSRLSYEAVILSCR